ncbi:MAG: type II toxin-antitoxin system MqsR family toxin [Alphaproteobacteria bacterium]|nr:type II toxin-antitoxin system MqsR family toxin [Alphaproteobacteria bacterium]
MVGVEKRKSTHRLDAIKAAMKSPATLRRTMVSARDAGALGMDAAAVIGVIQALRYPADFDKSATAHRNAKQWHDSYKPKVGRRTLYLKFTTDEDGAFLLTSFKEADT